MTLARRHSPRELSRVSPTHLPVRTTEQYKRGLRFVIIPLSLLLFYTLRARPNQSTDMATVAKDAQNAQSSNAFAFDLFSRLNAPNVFISPVSIAAALALAAKGVTPNSENEKQFKHVLNGATGALHTVSDQKVKIKVASSAWLDAQIKDEYKNAVQDMNAQVFPLTKDAQVVNRWVSTATERMIDNLLTEVPQNTIALLLNAVFFKAQWTHSFNKRLTRQMSFYAQRNEPPIKVRMMHMSNHHFPYTVVPLPGNGGFRMADLPYGDGTYTATIVLPHHTTTVDAVVEQLNKGGVDIWNKWVSRMIDTKLETMALPTFKLSYGAASIKPVLQAMGLKIAFEGDMENGAFTAMCDDKRVYVSDVVHKAVVECTEEGTKASAASAVIIALRSLPATPPPSLIVDRPFLFVIRNKVSGQILFIGHVQRPESP